MIHDDLRVVLRKGTQYWLNPSYPAFEVTSQIRNINIVRGKTSRFSSFPAATLTIEFNNDEGQFDSLATSTFDCKGRLTSLLPIEPIDTQFNPSVIVGPRSIVEVGLSDLLGIGAQKYLFKGFIADWNFVFTPDNQSIAILTAQGFEAEVLNREISSSDLSRPSETSGERIEAIVPFNTGISGGYIDTGVADLFARTNPAGTKVGDYANKIATYEGGIFFYDTRSLANFIERGAAPRNEIVLGDNGITFQTAKVTYGNELLYNDITLIDTDGTTANVTNTNSVVLNGPRTLELDGLPPGNQFGTNLLPGFLIRKYSIPKYRIESVDFNLSKWDTPIGVTAHQELIARAEIGDGVFTEFSPPNGQTQIVQAGYVQRVEHNITPDSWFVTLGINDALHDFLILDSNVLGYLDRNVLG